MTEYQEGANTNVWNLYQYIYNSKELRLLNESLNHGHTTLRNYLLVIANLIVQDLILEAIEVGRTNKRLIAVS